MGNYSKCRALLQMGLFCLEPWDELKKAEPVASLITEIPAEKQACIQINKTIEKKIQRRPLLNGIGWDGCCLYELSWNCRLKMSSAAVITKTRPCFSDNCPARYLCGRLSMAIKMMDRCGSMSLSCPLPRPEVLVYLCFECSDSKKSMDKKTGLINL